jgi:hydrogenase/urease accessory protein HupE
VPSSLPHAPLCHAAAGLRNAIRSAWAGLAAGCLHTLAGADHLAALTPLTIGRSQLKASLLGALWGFGHSTGQMILGLLMVVLKDRFQQVGEAEWVLVGGWVGGWVEE